MFNGGGYHMGGMHSLWWIFWVLLVGVLLFFWWGRSGAQQRHHPGDTPHDVLKRRLASGEITPEEYEKRKAILDRDAGTKS